MIGLKALTNLLTKIVSVCLVQCVLPLFTYPVYYFIIYLKLFEDSHVFTILFCIIFVYSSLFYFPVELFPNFFQSFYNFYFKWKNRESIGKAEYQIKDMHC